MKKATYTVTAALPYANGPLHLGHVAGVYLPADIFVRFLRMNEHDVVFICGSDEHGAAITLRAKKDGLTPKDIVDKYHGIIKNAFEKFDISFDIFHRTSTELHHETSADFFKKLHEQGKFIEETSEQYFDEEYQQFLADRYITGDCPKCQSTGAYGDQCEKCGSDLSPTDLINPKSTLSGKTPVLRSTSHWYLPLNDYETWFKQWILEEIRHINFLREDNARKVKQLNNELKKNGFKIKELEVMIESLQKDIQWKDEQIGLLQGELNNLDKEYARLFDAYQVQSIKVDELTTKLNQTYYAYGTEKELIENRVIEKKNGFIGFGKKASLLNDFNEKYFTEIDASKAKQITIEGRDIHISTAHPATSYVIEEIGNRSVIKIKDRSEFWKISKYLVVITN